MATSSDAGTIVKVSTEFLRNVLAASHKIWVETQQVPTVEAVAKTLYPQGGGRALSHVAKAMATPAYRDTCEARGIPVGTMPGLTAAQSYAAQILTNPADKRPMASKLKSAGITAATYQNWLRQPAFSAYVKKIGDDLLSNHIADVNAMLVNKATSGDTAAMKIYYEINGKLGAARDNNADLYQIINGLIDIITRRLAEYPQALMLISQDIDKILKGETVSTDLPMLEAYTVEPTEPTATEYILSDMEHNENG